MSSSPSARSATPAEFRRIMFGSVVGTAIEWYDFFLYATASALIFNSLFFPSFSPVVGTIAAFGTFAAGYVARPFGAIVFGHFGDRIGRKTSLVASLLIMGVATTLIGLLPAFDVIGVWAPILLVLLRLCQGFGVGGEWGGAVLLAVEHAPADRRGFYGSWPQVGVPLGLLLSTGVFSLVTALPQEQFLSWGWRIPFLLSLLLVGVGLFIRLQVPEPEVFTRAQRSAEAASTASSIPLVELLRRYRRDQLLALGTRFATDITFNTINVFVLAYATRELGLSSSLVLNAILVGSAVQVFTIPLFGRLSDRFGRRTVYTGGAVFVAVYGFIFFWLLQTGVTALVVLAFVGGLALSQASVYGVQSTWFAELFDTRVRFTGASLPYQFAGILTSAPTPLIATFLFTAGGSVWPIAGYIAVTAVISLVCARFLAETASRDLHAQPAAGPSPARGPLDTETTGVPHD